MEDLVQKTLEAHWRIKQYVYKTPLMFSRPLSKLASDCKVKIKLETEQLTGSFKIRGAFNKLLKMSSDSDTVKERGIITASSGNHGMACVEAGMKLGIPITVYCYKDVSEHKRTALQDRGVRVVLHGNDCVEAENEARSSAERQNTEYVSPYNDLDIIAGQGTIGIEILEDFSDVDSVLVPVGGGGLIAGIARYIKQVKPSVEIIGCQPQNSKVMYESVKAGRIVFEESLDTLSEGTAGGVEENSITFPLCNQYIDDWIMVTEEEIGKAIVYMLQHHQKVFEGAAGMTLGAFMKNPGRFMGKHVAIVACGANIGINTLKQLISMYT
ncbi:L-threonine ammonia-lyase-like [Saccostrea cucullata]|uniref:L-threonine ammonia-lyase-like n=1 Tax=Saccostrea cuccullata TaxID=36930 RepID=UPI002ED36125